MGAQAVEYPRDAGVGRNTAVDHSGELSELLVAVTGPKVREDLNVQDVEPAKLSMVPCLR